MVPVGVDGMSRDSCGNILIAAGGRINIVLADEQFIASQEIPGITNIEFGGASGRDILCDSLARPY